jgi:hypothetical protein
LHYKDEIYCAAGKIVHELQKQGEFSSLHIRRGDLQFKEVKISAAEWYNNTRELWKPNETLFIATDEPNKTWFDDLAKHHRLLFLDDYWDFAFGRTRLFVYWYDRYNCGQSGASLCWNVVQYFQRVH